MRRLIAALAIIGLLISPAWAAFPTAGILDTFTTTISDSWNVWDGEFNVSSDTLAPNSPDGFGYAEWGEEEVFTDCEFYVTIVTKSAGNNSPQIRIRFAPDESESFYEVQVNPSAGTVILVRYDEGSPTQLSDSASPGINNGDKVGISAVGSALKVYWYTSGSWNQTPIISTTDATYSSGWVFLLLQGSATQRMDDWGGTSSAPAAGGDVTYSGRGIGRGIMRGVYR